MKELNINFDYEIEEENKLDDWNRTKNSLVVIDKKGIIKVDKIINNWKEVGDFGKGVFEMLWFLKLKDLVVL